MTLVQLEHPMSLLGLPQLLDIMKGLMDNVNRAVFSLTALAVSSSIITVSPPATVSAQYLLGLGTFDAMCASGAYKFFVLGIGDITG
jgi:hypothetical protein